MNPQDELEEELRKLDKLELDQAACAVAKQKAASTSSVIRSRSDRFMDPGGCICIFASGKACMVAFCERCLRFVDGNVFTVVSTGVVVLNVVALVKEMTDGRPVLGKASL